MDIILENKPLLIGLHLGFAIMGIDSFAWFIGEVKNNSFDLGRKISAIIGLTFFSFSWLIGGYYYTNFYGSEVKPIIKEGVAPWAHTIFMETKEHIFLFIVPLAIIVLFLAMLPQKDFETLKLKKETLILAGLIVALGLSIGLMGFIISSAARWAGGI